MTLDDRLLKPAGWQYDDYKTTKLAILSDLLEIIGEDEEITITDPDTNDFGKVVGHPYNDLRQELREKVRKYCE